MKKIPLTIFTITLSVLIFNPAKAVEVDTAQQKSCFYSAYQKISNMLSGKDSLDYEKAVFLTENAYNNNQRSYESFKAELDLETESIRKLAEQYHSVPKGLRNDFWTSDEVKQNWSKSIIANYAIFKFITDTVILKRGNIIYSHSPCSYSYDDPMATGNWKNSQVMSLLDPFYKKGNCYALATLFKIFAERLGTDAKLVTAPNHIFIQHGDNSGIQYNIELATKAFPGFGSEQTITYTTDDAIKSGIALQSLDLKQSVSLCLVYLAKGYENKFKRSGDQFLLDCAELALQNDHLNLSAMLLKNEVLEKVVMNKNKTIAQLQADLEFQKYQNSISQLYELGYREMPLEMKNILISNLKKDTSLLTLTNHTPKPLPSIKSDNTRYATLSWGIFDEMRKNKPIENYGRALFDTRTKTVKGFQDSEQLYNGYNFDPAVFAMSVDPMTSKVPGMSPYNFVSNNPIERVDLDGNLDFDYTVTYRDNADGTKTKVVNAVAVYYVVNVSSNNTVSSTSIQTSLVAGTFSKTISPKNYGIDALAPGGKKVSNLEFNLSIKTVPLSPDQYGKLPNGANVMFIVDKIKDPGEGKDAMGVAYKGGQSILIEPSTVYKESVLAQEIAHNLGMGHYSGDNFMNPGGDNKGFLSNNQPPKEGVNDIIANFNLWSPQPSGQSYHVGDNNAKQQGQDFLKENVEEKEQQAYNRVQNANPK